MYDGIQFRPTFVFTGPTGIPGSATNTGATGPRSLTGYTGPRGQSCIAGPTSPSGSFGGVSFEYIFSANVVVSNPSAGRLKLNNTNSSLANFLSINEEDENGTNIADYLRTIDDSTSTIKGHYKISSVEDPAQFVFMLSMT